MAHKDTRPQALLNVTAELKGAYNTLLAVYEGSKGNHPKPEVQLREIDKTVMLLEHARRAVESAQEAGAYKKAATEKA